MLEIQNLYFDLDFGQMLHILSTVVSWSKFSRKVLLIELWME